MSWLTFWRGHRHPRAKRRLIDEAPPAAAATSDIEVDPSEELTECGVDAFRAMAEAHRLALTEGNHKKANVLLDGLRAFRTRPDFLAAERSQRCTTVSA